MLNRKQEYHSGLRNGRYFASFKFLLFSCFFLLFSNSSPAQCAMCRAVLESEDGGKKAEAVNDGIVYLMVFPYLLVGAIGYVIYRTRQKYKKEKLL